MSDAIETLGLTEPEKVEEVVTESVETNEEGFLTQFVGDGKKYKDVESLAKAYHNIDKHAEIVKKENEEYRQELEALKAKEKTVEEIMAAVNDQPEQVAPVVEAPQIDITSEVAKVLEQQELNKKLEATRNESKQKLVDAFGEEKVVDVVKNYIQGDPSRDQIVKTLTQTDPNGLVKLLESTVSTEENSVVNTTGVTTKTMNTNTAGIEITWSQAKELRKENPELYKKIQGKIHRSAEAADKMGIDYYGT